MDADARAIFGLLLLAVQVTLLAPLILRTKRVRSPEGISLPGEAIWVVAGAGWAIYGVGTSSPMVAASGTAAALGSAVLVLLLRRMLSRARVLLALMVTSVALLAGVALRGIEGLGLALAVVGVIQFLPQLAVSARLVTRPRPSAGVSAIASGLRALYTLGWAVYAGASFLWGADATATDWPLAIWGVAGAVTYTFQTIATVRGHSTDQRSGISR